MKFNKVIQIISPEYAYLKITPNNSVRNNSTFKIAKTIASIYKGTLQRIKREEDKLVKLLGKEFLMGTKYSYNSKEKVGYFIYIEKKKVEFYFIVPKQYISLIKEKALNVWDHVTIKEVEELPKFSNDSIKYQLVYDKEDALSLKTDRRDNDLLRSNLNVINVLGDEDKVGLFYNFIPSSQKTWRSKYKNTIEKVNSGEPVDKDKSKITFLFKYSIVMLSNLVNFVFSAFTEDNKNDDNLLNKMVSKLNGNKELSSSTSSKESATIIKTQIIAVSESKDKIKKYNNMKSIVQSFDAISEDNKFVAKKYNKELDCKDYTIKNVQQNNLSDYECGNLIALAGRDILDEYDFIDKVETRETQVPEDLRDGKILIGENTYRGNKQKAYLSTDKEFQQLALVLIGPNGSGKSTLIGNISYDAISVGECTVIFDFIRNCELSDEVTENFNHSKVLNITCDDSTTLQGLGYNEIKESDNAFEQYRNAKLQTTQLTTLINSINTEDKPLTTRMERYMQSAANIVFISNGSIKDVFEVLQNHKSRTKFLSKVPSEQHDDLAEYMESLKELDEKDKDGEIVGSKHTRVDGIFDRLNKLKMNPYMEQMLKIGCENNIDLTEEIQKNQLICIRMPESMFATDDEKNVYTTYWITKLWLALQVRSSKIKDRDKLTKVNLVIDELYQVRNTERFLTEKLSRLRKFALKPIISCHYLSQLTYIKDELKSASTSFMILSGSEKDNFNNLQNELKPFQLEDMLNLKRHHSINLIKNSEGYAKFISKMPPPIGKRISKRIAENV